MYLGTCSLAKVHVFADLLDTLASADLLLNIVAQAATAESACDFFNHRTRRATRGADHTHSAAQRVITFITYGPVKDFSADIASDSDHRAGVELPCQCRCMVRRQFRIERRDLLGVGGVGRGPRHAYTRVGVPDHGRLAGATILASWRTVCTAASAVANAPATVDTRVSACCHTCLASGIAWLHRRRVAAYE